jgi:hypothetical protein
MYHFLILGWHRRFNGKATHFTFTDLFQPSRKQANTVSIQVRLVEEQTLARYQRITYKRSQNRLSTLCEQYEAKTIHASNFLRAEGNIYAVAVPNPEPDQQAASDSD